MRPGGDRSNQKQNQYYQKNCAHTHIVPFLIPVIETAPAAVSHARRGEQFSWGLKLQQRSPCLASPALWILPSCKYLPLRRL